MPDIYQEFDDESEDEEGSKEKLAGDFGREVHNNAQSRGASERLPQKPIRC